MKKQVSFHNITDVYLIPSHKDIEYKKTIHLLWWDNWDFEFAVEEQKKEITEIMLRNKGMRYKDAVKLLYQPNNIRYDPSNFE
jgi:predicted double-glycine peptidase